MSLTATLTEERPFILCGNEYLRVDLIESFAVKASGTVNIRSTSGLAYTFAGTRCEFLRLAGVSEQVATA